MKVEDAALQIKQIYGVVSEEIKRALDVADDALSKQIAKKPKFLLRASRFICPVCGYNVEHKYCPGCGQKLDWSEEGEKCD